MAALDIGCHVHNKCEEYCYDGHSIVANIGRNVNEIIIKIKRKHMD